MTHQAPAPQAPQEPQQPQQGEQLPQQPPSPPQQQVFPQYQPQPQGYAPQPMPVAEAGPIAILIANLGLVVFILGLLAIFVGNGVDDLATGLTMTGGSLAVMLLAGIWNTLATIGYNLAVSQQLRQQ